MAPFHLAQVSISPNPTLFVGRGIPRTLPSCHLRSYAGNCGCDSLILEQDCAEYNGCSCVHACIDVFNQLSLDQRPLPHALSPGPHAKPACPVLYILGQFQVPFHLGWASGFCKVEGDCTMHTVLLQTLPMSAHLFPVSPRSSCETQSCHFQRACSDLGRTMAPP